MVILFQEKIEKIYNEDIENNSLFIILFNDIDKYRKIITWYKFINKIEDPNITLDIINHIEIVSSTLAGYGKSTYIEKELVNQNLILILFVMLLFH